MMIFWGVHCHGRFDMPTICYALDSGSEDVEHELRSLADLGIVNREVEDGVTLYSLTRNEDKRRAIVERVSPGHTES
jgi:DNA-binding transcriptional ArsR family regulator